MSDTPSPPPGEPSIRTVAMPADTNPQGDIFGGWLMSQMDLAGGIAAGRQARGRVATVAVDGMAFHYPVKVGDEVSVWAELVAVGRSSMRYQVSAWRRPRDSERHTRVTQAMFTFVALDSDGKPRPVPKPEAA
jgi:acyl-CoA thioesterase YciA